MVCRHMLAGLQPDRKDGPGPAFALIVRHSTLSGFLRVLVLRTELGLSFWIIAAAAGLAALVAASHTAFLELRATTR
jgi:threonine/homoserine/homoserine lactone efflux protein